jgi:hypothetical protein
MAVHIRWLCAFAALLATTALGDSVRLGAEPGSGPRSMVVVELFTSEGCSSCPPADAVLSQLVLRQPVVGVEVLALLVVDGQLERVGSDVSGVQRAITQAARAPKAAVDVAAFRANDRLRVDVHVDVPQSLTLRESADVLVAITEDNLVTEVRRGENGGRTLRHSAVARSWTSVGTLSPHEGTWSTSASVPVAPEWKPANLRVVSFLQERASRRIVGAGAARVVIVTR